MIQTRERISGGIEFHKKSHLVNKPSHLQQKKMIEFDEKHMKECNKMLRHKMAV